MGNLLYKPVIFFGTGRSGSTIISEILFKHPAFAFPSNYHQKFPTIDKVSYLRRLVSNQYWMLQGAKAPIIGNLVQKLSFVPSEAWNMWDHILPEEIPFTRGFLAGLKADIHTKDSVRAYFLRMVQMQNRQRLGFKITGPGRLVYLNSIFPEAIFVHIKRRIVPTISSFLKVPFWQKQGMKQLWWFGAYHLSELLEVEKNIDNPVWMTAFQLKKILDVIETEQIGLEAKILNVDYEEFSLDPKTVISKLLNELEIYDNNNCLNYLNSLTVKHNTYEDKYYFNEDEISTIYKIFKNE